MDLRRLRFGDWVMGFGGLAVLGVMFLDWYEVTTVHTQTTGDILLQESAIVTATAELSAWQAFSVTDLVLLLPALLAVVAFVLTLAHPTAAAPLALGSLAATLSLIALLLVGLRLIWPPDLGAEDAFETTRLAGAWLGLVATTILTAGTLASIRDERLPRPERPVEPELVSL